MSIVINQTSNDADGDTDVQKHQDNCIYTPRLLHEILSSEPDDDDTNEEGKEKMKCKLHRIPASSIITPQHDHTIVLSLQFMKYKSKVQWDSRPWSLDDIRGACIHECCLNMHQYLVFYNTVFEINQMWLLKVTFGFQKPHTVFTKFI